MNTSMTRPPAPETWSSVSAKASFDWWGENLKEPAHHFQLTLGHRQRAWRIAYVKRIAAGLEAGLLYGTELSVTSAASGLTSSTSQTGRAFSVSAGQTEAPVAQKINPEVLAQDVASLEKSAEPPASDAADEQSGASDQPAARTQPEDSGEEPATAENDQDKYGTGA